MDLKNSLAEKGKREEGGMKRKGKSRVQWERQENWEEHTLKPMLIYPSSQTKQTSQGKESSCLGKPERQL